MIKDNIRFVGFISFYNRRYIIKELYTALNRDDKLTYKYYVYSRRHLTEYTCDLIWRFLNDDFADEQDTIEMLLQKECFKYKM